MLAMMTSRLATIFKGKSGLSVRLIGKTTRILFLIGLIIGLLGLAMIVVSFVFFLLPNKGEIAARTGQLQANNKPQSQEPTLSGWKQLYPLTQMTDAASISIVDAMHGWLVGAGGTIMKTDDGVSWKVQQSNATRYLNTVSGVDQMTAWAAGEAGMVLHTTDGGSKWVASSVGESDITRACAMDRSTVWMVTPYINARNPGAVIKSGDAGASWQYYIPRWPKTGNPREREEPRLADICASSPKKCWAIAYRRVKRENPEFNESQWDDQASILRTVDGGLTWTDYTPLDTGNISSFCAPAEDSFWICCRTTDGIVAETLKTDDGGENWSQVAWVPSATSMTCSDRNTIWMLGASLSVTRDGGAHWQIIPVSKEITARLDSEIEVRAPTTIAASDGRTAWVVTTGVFKTGNAGRSWTQQVQTSRGMDFRDVSLASGQTAWVLYRDKAILRTEDGGANWQETKDNEWFATSRVWGFGNDVAWAWSSRLAKTIDGGKSWQNIKEPQDLWSFEAVDGQTGWGWGVSPDRGRLIVYKTDDGGNTWLSNEVDLEMGRFDARFKYISAVDGQVAWLFGNGDSVVRVADSGRTSQLVHEDKAASHGVDSSQVSAATEGIAVLVKPDLSSVDITEDGGLSWTSVTPPNGSHLSAGGYTPSTLVGVKMHDRKSIWILARSEISTGWMAAWFLIRSEDGGATWQNELVEYNTAIDAFDVSSGEVWVVGTQGLLMKKTL